MVILRQDFEARSDPLSEAPAALFASTFGWSDTKLSEQVINMFFFFF